jgi:hypothetical protein
VHTQIGKLATLDNRFCIGRLKNIGFLVSKQYLNLKKQYMNNVFPVFVSKYKKYTESSWSQRNVQVYIFPGEYEGYLRAATKILDSTILTLILLVRELIA